MTPRVFLLEDDVSIIAILRPAFQKEGFQFESLDRAQGTIDAVRRFKPDLILLDVDLPDGDGFEVCKVLRQDKALDGIPVIFLTARSDVQNRLKGFAAGGQDYVPKPFAVEEVLARARAHLSLKTQLDAAGREKEALAALERARQDVADMLVHDLRIPVTTIRVTLQLLRQSGLISRADYAQVLKNAENSADLLVCMLNDLLDLSAGKVKIAPADLDLGALFGRLEATIGAQFQRKKVQLKLETATGLPGLRTDPDLLLRILMNLSFNALKFSESGATVAVGALPLAGGGLRLEVSDQGPGIPDAEKKKIFLKGYRAEYARAALVPGRGIGLAFCHLACQCLGGRIWVEDRPGGGSRFIVELPPWSGAGPQAPSLFGPEVMQAYAQECRTQIARAQLLNQEIAGPRSPQALAELKGIFHRLAGSAGTYGFDEASHVAHLLEVLMSSCLAGQVAANAGLQARLGEEINDLARRVGAAKSH